MGKANREIWLNGASFGSELDLYIQYYYYYYLGVQGVLVMLKMWIIVKGKRSDLSERLGCQALFA